MARLTSGGVSIRPYLLHALVELALMNIFMTACAIQVFPVIDEILGLELIRLFVAIDARYGDMPASEHESGLLVLGQGKGRGLVSLQIVAFVASVQIRGRGKLTGMAILMAISAEIKLHPVQRVLALRNVTLCALHSGVPTLKRVFGGSVLLHSEKGGLPALHIVAGGTLARVCALRELSVVCVFMAIRTLCKCNLLLEIAVSGVALFALYLRVFALEGILGL